MSSLLLVTFYLELFLFSSYSAAAGPPVFASVRHSHGSPPLVATLDGVELWRRQLWSRHLSNLPLRGRPGPSPHLTLLLRRIATLRAPVVPAAMDQEFRHPVLRALQVPVYHAHQDQALQKGLKLLTLFFSLTLLLRFPAM